MKTTLFFGLYLSLILASSQSLAADPAETWDDELARVISNGKVSLSFRHRFEFVDHDGFGEDAEASTLKTRLSLQSGDLRGFDAFLEFDDVREIIWDDFNAGGGNTPGRSRYPVVADPEGAEVNQAYVDYSGFENWGLRLGRQRINLDNQRFVGGVGWRQHEQTFNAFRANWGNDLVDVTYSYVDQVRRIFGESVPAPAGKDSQDNTHFLNASGDTALGKVVGYYYHYDSQDRSAFSSGTVGARLTGSRVVGDDDWTIRYEAEFAFQRDVGDNPNDVSAEYLHLDVAAVFDIYDVAIGLEVLSGSGSSSGNEAFQTPLATLHAFNGWADVFLTTPGEGLEDKYLKFKASPGDYVIDVRYHDFEAESGGASYGDEIDLRFGYKFNKRFRGDLFWASFDNESGNDVTKLWLMATLTL